MDTYYQAFTYKYKPIANRLITPVTISSDGKSIEIDALWDTGASGTNISKEVVSSLGLVATGMTYVQTAGGIITSGTYLVDVLLPNKVLISNVKVCDSEIGNQGIGMLVGMDLISMGDFVISSFGGTTTFSYRFPSKQSYDFVIEAKKDNIITAKKNKKQKHIPHKR